MTTTALRQLVHVTKGSSFSSTLSKVIAKGDDWTKVNNRHIFRALLRQCTYLPDSFARHYFRNHVVMRFRRYNPRPPVSSDLTLRLQQVKVQKELVKKARKFLGFLERANNGHQLALEKMLALTYGCQGRRRRELVQQLMQDSPPRQELLAKFLPSMPARPTEPILGNQLEALLKSQRRFEGRTKLEGFGKLQRSQKLGLLRPTIPETNSWGHPMPLKRVQNIKEKWYAELLDKIRPPLPKEEWERLRDLATGVRKEVLIQRRKRAGMGESKFNGTLYGEPFFPPRTHSWSDLAESPQGERRGGVLTNFHQLTPRYRRRMWTSIFVQCPCMTWDAVEGKWTVQWGNQQIEEYRANIPGRSVAMSVFEGVDKHGNVVSTR